jgi:hypothetical protein
MNIKLVEKKALHVEDLKNYRNQNYHARINQNIQIIINMQVLQRTKFFGHIIVIIIPIKKTRNKLEYITRCAG